MTVERPKFLNSELETIHPNPDWEGAFTNGNGRFINQHEPFKTSFGMLLKWQLFSRNPQKEQKENDNRRLPFVEHPEIFSRKDDAIIWLGHASFLIRLGGKTLLTDPVFFESIFLNRHVPLPFDPDTIANVDYILLSHDHRDHCDKRTLQFITKKCPDVQILTGLKLEELIRPWLSGNHVQEAAWYQKYDLVEDFEIIYVPSRHWSKRGLTDERKRLWGGFMIRYRGKQIYFMSDSGYGRHFADIKEICGAPDYALMGIGAYKPEWFMQYSHISPTDAIRAYQDLGARRFIPMHYGTFDLSDEPLLDPIDVLKKQKPDGLRPLAVGEPMLLTFGKASP